VGLTVTGACLAAQAAPPAGADLHSFHIPREDAVSAVLDFAHQARVHVMVSEEQLAHVQTNAVEGTLTIEAALTLLVAGTGLTYTYLPEHHELTVVPLRDPAPAHLPGPPAASSGHAVGLPPVVLPEVVVSAQRRPQDLQTLPQSARVVDGAALTEQHLASLDDLSEVSPDIHIGSNSRSANLYIRGTGSGESQIFDQSVPVFLDDVDHPRGRTSGVELLDLERIEILKGPQSTFFGANAIAGAINVVSRQPTDAFEADTRLLYGEHGDYAAEGAVSGAVSDALSARLAVLADGTGGWLYNETAQRDVPVANNLAGRLTLRLLAGPDLTATLKIEGSRNRNIGSLALQDAGCPPPAPFATGGFCKTALATGEPVGLGINQVAQNAGQEILLSTGESVLTVKYTLADQTLTSVTGWYHYRFNENEDADGTALQLFNIQAPEKYWQLSQELRLASPTTQRLTYLAGLYFQEDHLEYSHDNSYFFLTPSLTSPALAALDPYLPLGQHLTYEQPEKTYSAFVDGTWHISERWSASAGLRASWVQKSYDWSLSYGTAAAPFGNIETLPAPADALARAIAAKAGLGAAGILQGKRKDHGLMPLAQLQYALAGAMAYLSFVRGWKAGGFNGNDVTGSAANLPFDPEHVNAYEAGLKSEWLGHRLRVNVDAFRSDYTDLQVATNLPAGPAILSLVRNAASSRTQGVELELDWAPAAAWRLSAHATYDESRYLGYPAVAPTQLQQLEGQVTQDLSGRPTEFAPKWSGTLRASYILRLPGNLRLTSSAAGIASSSFYLTGNDDPAVEQQGYVRLDASMTLGGEDGRWALDLIGRNLTNRDILTFGINWPTSPGGTWLQKEEPRNAAVQARLSW
jgi:outer membrane receptor protein involved in Fe transport